MKLKDFKISTQLRIGFSILILFVVILSTVSYTQKEKLYQQLDTMYEHPFQVRIALGDIEEHIKSIQFDYRNALLADTRAEIDSAMQQTDVSEDQILKAFNVLEDRYLGSQDQVQNARNAFVLWLSSHEQAREFIYAGKLEEAKKKFRDEGEVGRARAVLLFNIKKIDDFAKAKAEQLFETSKQLKKELNFQLLYIFVTVLLLSLIIIYTLLRNIQNPINNLTEATQRFHQGDMEARSSYLSENEFGILAHSYNTLAEGIQKSLELREKAADISGIMLSEDDISKFFQTTLTKLASHTGSQMGAIYLLSEDKKSFEHFFSLGMNGTATQTFKADSFEGEFGPALFSHKVQHIKKVAENTRFVLNTPSGKFIPSEILTIPIYSNETIAVVSLATVGQYSQQALDFIESILDTMTARAEGVIVYRKIKEFSEKLEQQNIELQEQKSEMASQSVELVNQNAELEMQKKQLDEANKLKTNFLANMSHELRTPLNSVIALSGVLNRRLINQIPQEEYSYLEVIERNGKHLLALINDILDISRIEAGREEIEITKFNPNHLIDEVNSMIYPQAKQKQIELIHRDSEVEMYLTSDADKCRHILQNLVGNAVKFTGKGKVEVVASQSVNNVIIRVIDTGIGIAEENLAHIFDEFRQADGSTSRSFGGSGLGLAIAKKYANLLNGTISVKSVIGKGSEFTLILPLHYSQEHEALETERVISFHKEIPIPAPEVKSDNRLQTVLLVEDSEPAIIQIRDILEEIGYRILVAHDGGEALGIIGQTIPDAMILDLMMPGIDGFEVLKTLREEEVTAHIPVLILTAKQITKEELKFLSRNNVHQLIQKGDVRREELQNAVAGMVKSTVKVSKRADRVLPSVGEKAMVLIVEDNADNMLTVKAILGDSFRIVEAENGVDAVKMTKEHSPNLILMDIALPGMNGIEAFKAIRENVNYQHIPIIALTASAMDQDRETILAYGFDAYVAKPIDEKELFKTIREILYGK